MTTINRRTALLGSVTLPAALAPLGMATGEIPQSEPDPAVFAYREWLDALTANNADPNDNDTPEGASSRERYPSDSAPGRNARTKEAGFPTLA